MTQVFVYKNLTTKKWQYGEKPKSVKTNPQKDALILRGVTFKIMRGGFNFTAKTFAETGKKARTVHAFACGEIVDGYPVTATRRAISYNPFRGDFFYDCETGEPVTACDFVFFTADQKAFAITCKKEI